MNFDTEKLVWTRPPERYRISPEQIEITTQPHTDLWQRTYYQWRTRDPNLTFAFRRILAESKPVFDSAGLCFIWTARTG